MATLYNVQKVESKLTKGKKEYLLMTLNEQIVSFFDEKDVQVPVSEGQTVTCRIIKNGNFKNGHDLKIADSMQKTIPSKPESASEPVSASKIAPASKPTQAKQITQGKPQDEIQMEAGNRTFHFTRKTGANGTPYVCIIEELGGKKNQIMIFDEFYDDFLGKLQAIRKKE